MSLTRERVYVFTEQPFVWLCERFVKMEESSVSSEGVSRRWNQRQTAQTDVQPSPCQPFFDQEEGEQGGAHNCRYVHRRNI